MVNFATLAPYAMRTFGSRQVASFGPFELDLRAGELRRDGHTLILQEQPFLILKTLLEHPGNVITREEIRQILWPDDTVVEFDQSINAAIKKLRTALQDSAEEPLFVETVARRGYRLIVPVQWSEPPLTHNEEVQSERPVASASDQNIDGVQVLSAQKKVRRRWAVALAIAAVFLIALLIVAMSRKPKTRALVLETKLRQLTFNTSENPVISGAISPDGKYLAYSDTRGLHLKLIDTGETHTVPEPEALRNQNMKWGVVGWFPNSVRFLANAYPATEEWYDWNSATADIWAVSVLGEEPTKLREHALGCAISPDGTEISFENNRSKLGDREVWFMGPNGERARKIYEAKEGTVMDCSGWSPDGKHYLYVSRDDSGSTAWVQPLDGGLPVTVLRDTELYKMNDFVWLHDGRVIYGSPESDAVCNYWTMRFDVATGRRLEEPRRLTNWPNFCAFSGSITKDDKRLAFAASSGFYTSYLADLEASGRRISSIRRLTLEQDNRALGWTVDGQALVAKNGDHWTLYKQSLDSDTPEPISSLVAGGALLLGAVTPDGKWYIGRIWPNDETVGRPTIPFPIVRIPLSGGSPEIVLQLSRHGNVSCTRQPSSMCVLAEQSEDRKQMIVSMFDPLKGRGPELARFDFARELATIEVPTCVVSPDGTRLAIARSPESPIEIYSLHGQLIRTIPSRSEGKLTWLEWSPDQEGFFVSRRGKRDSELLYLDLHGNATSLRKCTEGDTCHGLPSRDGHHLAIIDRDQSNNMWMMENF